MALQSITWAYGDNGRHVGGVDAPFEGGEETDFVRPYELHGCGLETDDSDRVGVARGHAVVHACDDVYGTAGLGGRWRLEVKDSVAEGAEWQQIAGAGTVDVDEVVGAAGDAVEAAREWARVKIVVECGK